MLCSACQTNIPADAAFCPKCGQRVGEPSAAAAVPGTQPTSRTAPAEPERELWRGSYSFKAMIGSWVLAGFGGIAALVSIFVPPFWMGVVPLVLAYWLYLLCYLGFQRLSIGYTLTTLRLIHKVGVLRQVTNRIDIIDIDDVTYEQGLFERFLGVGSIQVQSSDSSHPKLILRGIDNVQQVATLIDKTSGDERRRRGAFIEAV